MIRIAAVSDLHFRVGEMNWRSQEGKVAARFAGVRERADILLLAGDLTDSGSLEEGRLLAEELAGGVALPILAVLGNHDFCSRTQSELVALLDSYGIRVLDGDTAEFNIRGETVGIVGIRGFRGGFDRHALTERC